MPEHLFLNFERVLAILLYNYLVPLKFESYGLKKSQLHGAAALSVLLLTLDIPARKIYCTIYDRNTNHLYNNFTI